MKITIIGAGSTYTPELIEGIIERAASLAPHEIALMDIDERKLSIVGALAQRMVASAGLRCDVTLSMDLDASLKDADFVLVQIRVGKLAARHLDESIPLSYGLLGQETTGIGGFFKGQRTIPVLMHIASRMQALCENAWLINFSNPSGMVAEALLNHSAIRSIGLCNVPFNMMKSVKEKLGLTAPSFTFVGLNHLTWITSVCENGRDYLQDAIAQGLHAEGMKNIPATGFPPELIRAVKAIPCSYLEYIYFTRRKIETLQSAEKTRAQQCMAIEEELLCLYRDTALASKPDLLNARGGANYSRCAISLVDAIYNDKREVHVVNTKNKGALPFMASEDVVEIASIVGRAGPVPVPVSAFDNLHIINLVRQFKVYERYAVEAALTGDRDAAMLALLANPLIRDYDAASACFAAMLEAHQDDLPQYFR